MGEHDAEPEDRDGGQEDADGERARVGRDDMQAVVCTLHRGITRGLLDRLAPDAQLTGFLAKDPDTAGCEITVATV